MGFDSTLDKSVRILNLIFNDVNRFTDIMKSMGYGKGTTHRFLRNLENTELIFKDPLTKKYYLGELIYKFASIDAFHTLLIAISSNQILHKLQKISGETVCLCKRIGIKKLIVDEFPSESKIKFSYGKGFSSPIYTGATGRALLSLLKDSDVNLLLANTNLVASTPRTIVDKNKLIKKIKKVRLDKYAISYGEATGGTAAISVPLYDGTNSFALSVVGPENRFRPEAIVEDIIRITKDLNSNGM